jgi:hypothetical protein
MKTTYDLVVAGASIVGQCARIVLAIMPSVSSAAPLWRRYGHVSLG